MNRLETIEKELDGYKEIISKVESLKKEKKAILKEIEDKAFDALPFEKQFEKFYKSKKGVIKGDLYQLSLVAPKFKKKFVDDEDLERHVEYNIEDVAECLRSIFDKKAREEYQEDLGYEDDDFKAEMKDLCKIAKELMVNNIRGWEQDW